MSSAPTPVEWRVTCEELNGEWLAWRVRVWCRAKPSDGEPGQWRMVRDDTYQVGKRGQVPRDYWKDLIRSAAR